MFASLVSLAVAIVSLSPSALAFAPTSLSTPTLAINNAGVRNVLIQNKKTIQHIGGIDSDYIQQRAAMHVMASTNNPEEEGEEEDKKSASDEIFWAKQRAFAAQMSANVDADVVKENKGKFAKRRLALTYDTLYFSILIASLLWLVYPNPFVTLSYMFGALSGTAYSYGLGKFVETIGGSIDDVDVEGAGVGQARFAFLILLFVVVGKFRSQGLLEIPSIAGFFTYQLASLNQGLREIDD